MTASFALGALALLPYMALWRPKAPGTNPCPPPSEDLKPLNCLFLRGAETPVLPAALLAGSIYYLAQAFTQVHILPICYLM